MSGPGTILQPLKSEALALVFPSSLFPVLELQYDVTSSSCTSKTPISCLLSPSFPLSAAPLFAIPPGSHRQPGGFRASSLEQSLDDGRRAVRLQARSCCCWNSSKKLSSLFSDRLFTSAVAALMFPRSLY